MWVTHLVTGHSDEINCVDIDAQSGICLAASLDGKCLAFNTKTGSFMFSLNYRYDMKRDDPTRVLTLVRILQNTQRAISYCAQRKILYLHSLEMAGRLLAWRPTGGAPVDVWTMCRNERYLITGGEDGTLALWTVGNNESEWLRLESSVHLPAGITSLVVVELDHKEFLLIGMADGLLRTIPLY